MKRKSFDQFVQIGYLYDARSEKVVNISIFNTTSLPQNLITSIDTKKIQNEFTLSNSFEEKCKKFGVSAELKLDILSGSINLSGSGKF